MCSHSRKSPYPLGRTPRGCSQKRCDLCSQWVPVSTWRWWGAYAWEYWRFLRAPPLGEGTASAKIRKLQDTERLQKERGKSSKNLENQKNLEFSSGGGWTNQCPQTLRGQRQGRNWNSSTCFASVPTIGHIFSNQQVELDWFGSLTGLLQDAAKSEGWWKSPDSGAKLASNLVAAMCFQCQNEPCHHIPSSALQSARFSVTS